MLSQMFERWPTFSLVFIAILVILLVVFTIGRLFRAAIGVAVILVVAPVLFSVFWGDGTEYVDALSEFLSEKQSEMLQTGYHYYLEQEKKDPIIDYDAVSEAYNKAKDDAVEKAQGIAREVVDDAAPLVEDVLDEAEDLLNNTVVRKTS